MSTYVISCDTVARLSNIIVGSDPTIDQPFHHIRLDNGCAVATNRKFMAVEYIGNGDGVFYLKTDPAFIAQCQMEAQFNSKMTIVANDDLQFATLKTDLGYTYPGNPGYWPIGNVSFDRWREIIATAKEPPKKSSGAMFWDVDDLKRLAACSPSGSLVWQNFIDTNQVALMRDFVDPNWIAAFNPWPQGSIGPVDPAKVPSWLVC